MTEQNDAAEATETPQLPVGQLPAEIVAVHRKVFRQCMVWLGWFLLGLTAVALPLGYLIDQRVGLIGAILGVVFVTFFTGSALGIMWLTAGKGLGAMSLAMIGGLVGRFAVLISVILIFRDADFFNQQIFAVVLIVGFLAALTLEMLVVKRTREPYVLPKSS